MKFKILGALVLFCGLNTAFAASAPVKIADCTIAADQDDPAAHVQVFRDGSNANDASEYSVQYDAGTLSKRLSVNKMEWLDGGQGGVKTLALQCGFVVFQIKDGNSADSQAGGELGVFQPMTCTASF